MTEEESHELYIADEIVGLFLGLILRDMRCSVGSA